MEQRDMSYLSGRIKWLFAALAGLVLFLLFVCLILAVAAGEPFWPFLLGMVWLVLILWGAIALVVKPFRKKEQAMRLFLEGYTTTDKTMQDLTALTPSEGLMTERLMKMMDSSELLKLNKRQAQYLALQNQINPHFLYNTLESIRSEALIAGLDRVADMTEALATFFRYTISKVENLVSVEEELENCRTYFSIQQYRFGSRLNLSVECDEIDRDEIYACRIPKLTMQPILENSIIHGIECKIGSGHLIIHLELSGGRLLLRISDDGVGMNEQALAAMNDRLGRSGIEYTEQNSETKGGIALVNVNNRIHLLFGEEYGIHVGSMPDVGTDVEVTLPAMKSDREVRKARHGYEGRDTADGAGDLSGTWSHEA